VWYSKPINSITERDRDREWIRDSSSCWFEGVYVSVLGERISNGRSPDLLSGIVVGRADLVSSEPKADKHCPQCEPE
jgi:hypothetical protein